MTHFVTQQDVDDLLHFAALSAAARLQVPYAEWESIQKLVSAVQQKDQVLGAALTEFISAYTDWFKFHEALVANAKGRKFDASERDSLAKLRAARDAKRSAFISALKSGLE